MENLLNPKIDYVFKRIFGHNGSENITKDLLECIMNIQISSLDLDKSTILEKELKDDKVRYFRYQS